MCRDKCRQHKMLKICLKNEMKCQQRKKHKKNFGQPNTPSYTVNGVDLINLSYSGTGKQLLPSKRPNERKKDKNNGNEILTPGSSCLFTRRCYRIINTHTVTKFCC